MTMKEVAEYFDKKIEQNENFIRITFYEIRVKYNLTEDEMDKFLEIAKNKFENIGYNVFFTGAKYKYGDVRRIVEQNELMIAIKG